MYPVLKAGEELLLRPLSRTESARVGDIVVLNDPRGGRQLVKRVVRVEADEIWVEGDNRLDSTDSRTFGAVPRASVVGRVTCRFG